MKEEKYLRVALLAFVAFGVLFAVLSALVVNGITDTFDQSTLLWINQRASDSLDALFVSSTQLGGVYGVVLLTLALILYLVVKKRYDKAVLIVASVGGIAVINTILKSLFDRPRPDLWEWLVTETSFSFPSGHSAASAALAFSLIILAWNTKWRVATIIAGAIYIVVIGASRMYLGVHYPSDVLGGWLLAATWVSLVASALMLIKYRHLSHKERA